jgi:hypothetical protein
VKTLSKTTGLLNVDKAGPIFTPQLFAGWRQIVPNDSQFVHETYFDLAGLSQGEKTIFFEGATVQDLQNPTGTGSSAGDLVLVADIMSALPLNDVQLQSFATFGNMQGNVAFPTFDQTIYARNRVFTVDVDFAATGYYVLLSDNQLGSMSPTASDRIYVYRVVIWGTNNTGTNLSIWPSRFLLQMKAREEPDFEYIMRLKRSYDLQQSYDED